MNSSIRIPLIRYLLLIYVISCTTTIVSNQAVEGAFDYETDEGNNEYNQDVYSNLNGKIRELVSVNDDDDDDTDTRFQPPLETDSDQRVPTGEGYWLANSPDLIPSKSIPVANEEILQRHKRNDVTWNVNFAQITVMDGSGETEVTSEATTETTPPSMTIHLTSTEITNASTTTSHSSTEALQQTQSSTTVSSLTTAEVGSASTQLIGTTAAPANVSTTESTFITIIHSTIGTTTTTTSTITSVTTSTTTTTTSTITSVVTSTATTATTTTTSPLNCVWTAWTPQTNCSASCGLAYRIVIRACIDSGNSQSCSSNLCGGGSAIQNQTCSASPPCQNLTVVPPTNTRDPNIRIVSYALPDPMYFFDQTYRRIWISNKGYISFDTPYYSQTMSRSNFWLINGQAIAAPFWADMSYDTTSSSITINWFSSTDSSGNNNANQYYPIIQSVISSACPTGTCSLNPAAARVARISWQNLVYELPYTNQSIRLSFSAYLINTYEYSSYSYPVLRSYLAFDYSNLTNNLGYLRPFVGYRGQNSPVQIQNDPAYSPNPGFLRYSGQRRFYVGGRFLSQCEVSFLQETRINTLYPWENLNDEVNNPRFACPCTLGQAFADGRFGRLFSETYNEYMQGIVCYAPRVITWSWWRWGWDWNWNWGMLKAQTCCYSWYNWALITSGPYAGSVLSNPYILFWPFTWLRRIPFHDQCCSPSYTYGYPDWSTCQLYYQLHPPSTCTGYRPPAIGTFNGDPHITTIDNGRYTCHVQGLFIFAQTTNKSIAIAQQNLANSSNDPNAIYPDDQFQIYVRSKYVAPALSYIERTKGYGSIFTNYTLIALNYTFQISNDNGQFGCTINNDSTFSGALANNLNYEYTNADLSNISAPSSDRFVFRLEQTTQSILNTTVPQLILTLWSGLSIQFEIIGENLECTLTLPDKFRGQIEGLAGNFNGNFSDDLVTRNTSNIITISNATNRVFFDNDAAVLSACRSWRVPGDPTPDNSTPIMPMEFVRWYYNNASDILAGLNPLLSQSVVNQTCGTNFECVHDYLIRINAFTSAATASIIASAQNSKVTLAMKTPTINITSPVQIYLPSTDTNRNYILPINITDGIRAVLTLSINGTQQYSTITSDFIIIPMPNTTSDFVEVLLSVEYGTNSTWSQYLDIIACLCANNGTCNDGQTTTKSTHYQLASCVCPDRYEGDLCQSDYNGCSSGSACTLNWNNGTTCTPLNASEQDTLGRSYSCSGSCAVGYETKDNFTCTDVNECNMNSSLCGNGSCINLVGSYSCNCSSGYRFNGTTCIDIDECTEPNTDGTFPQRCGDNEFCINTDGTYMCNCSSNVSINGTCGGNSSLCLNDTCIIGNQTICLHGTINVNNSCVPWCLSTCPNFCERINNNFQCNCAKFPGYQYSTDGKSCLPCGQGRYGYNCSETCECVYGTCNANATNVNESCSCSSGYQEVDCGRVINACVNNGPCDNVTEDCVGDPNNGTAICSCKAGYERDNTSTCINIDECARNISNCDPVTSFCADTSGSYVCTCRSGYQLVNTSCVDINECIINTSCANYTNVYCANTPGSYQCRCTAGYSVGGDRTRAFGNVFNTINSCILTDYSSDCTNGCKYPANCSSSGSCVCPITPSNATFNLAVSSDPLRETCQCAGHPFVYYDGIDCVNTTGQTYMLLTLTKKPSGRFVLLNSSQSNSLEDQISTVLSTMNITCNGSCIDIYDTENVTLPDLELLVSLDVPLNSTERSNLAERLFANNVTYNASYQLDTIRIAVNRIILVNETFTNPALIPATTAATTMVYTGTELASSSLDTSQETSTTRQTSEEATEVTSSNPSPTTDMESEENTSELISSTSSGTASIVSATEIASSAIPSSSSSASSETMTVTDSGTTETVVELTTSTMENPTDITTTESITQTASMVPSTSASTASESGVTELVTSTESVTNQQESTMTDHPESTTTTASSLSSEPSAIVNTASTSQSLATETPTIENTAGQSTTAIQGATTEIVSSGTSSAPAITSTETEFTQETTVMTTSQISDATAISSTATDTYSTIEIESTEVSTTGTTSSIIMPTGESTSSSLSGETTATFTTTELGVIETETAEYSTNVTTTSSDTATASQTGSSLNSTETETSLPATTSGALSTEPELPETTSIPTSSLVTATQAVSISSSFEATESITTQEDYTETSSSTATVSSAFLESSPTTTNTVLTTSVSFSETQSTAGISNITSILSSSTKSGVVTTESTSTTVATPAVTESSLATSISTSADTSAVSTTPIATTVSTEAEVITTVNVTLIETVQSTATTLETETQSTQGQTATSISSTNATTVFVTVPVETSEAVASTSTVSDTSSTIVTVGLTNATIATTFSTDTSATTAASNTNTATGSPITSASTTGSINNITTNPVISNTTTTAPITDTTTNSFITNTTTTVTVSTSTTTGTSTYTSTTSSTAIPQNCTWTNWIQQTNCTPNCGLAYRTLIRACINSFTGASCGSSLCEGGSATQNQTCSASPPCENLAVVPPTNTRDPNIRIVSYALPDPMYFFDRTYRRIWISNKGYISFDTPYYSQTMTTSNFWQMNGQAIAAPFWADMLYDTSDSVMAINWFSSIHATSSGANEYSPIIQSVISSTCPTGTCSLNPAAARVARISWQNLVYELPYTNQSIRLSFSAYLINTYEYSSYSYPVLRSYLAFDYSNLTNNLGYLRPFVGYRGERDSIQIFNGPSYSQNAGSLRQSGRRRFYVGGRFLSQCEVSFLQELRTNTLYPWENLNDEVNNPRFPCPCTINQAAVDSRFSRLFSENSYERSQNILCYAPMTTSWVRWGWTWKLLRPQTCCYNSINRGLITSGPFAGSVLSNSYILMSSYSWLRRIPFHDQCCSPTYTSRYPDWNTCQFYYQLHPASTCIGYRAPSIGTGVGDPHIVTIDNGQYTCHIQGLYTLARTTEAARTAAINHEQNNVADMDLICTDDLFEIRVQSVRVTPVTSYIATTYGYGSVFSQYMIIAANYSFEIRNNAGRFVFAANGDATLTSQLSINQNYDYTNYNNNTNTTQRYVYRLQQTNDSINNQFVPQLTLALWSGLTMKCRIVGENLDCVLVLPDKFRSYIEGLAGNFNGDYTDDLVDRSTSLVIPIADATDKSPSYNETAVYQACESWRVGADTTARISSPIMPLTLFNSYYRQPSFFTSLNPLLGQSVVNQTCDGSFQCVHDYLIRINPFTSAATAAQLETVEQSKVTLAMKTPTINVTSPAQIYLPSTDTNRNYILPINITDGIRAVLTLSINGTQQNSNITSDFIIIPMPNTTSDFVEVLLSVEYGTNSTWSQYLDIIACLCANNGTCNDGQTTTKSTHYQLASCVCPDRYEGDLCQSDYNGCSSGSACTLNWNNGTTCTPLNASEQDTLGRSYSCSGSCAVGYETKDNFTCTDVNECNMNSSLCGNGSCINLVGSYSCNCSSGYRFNGTTCIDIDECNEPNTDGTFPQRCNDSEVCQNTIGGYTCACSPIFNTTGTCVFNSSLCLNETCRLNNGPVLCLRGTIRVNNTCVPWCLSTCPNFCERINNNFQCNCAKFPGYQYSTDGKSCLPCGQGRYGYNCSETCECVYGTCNANATNVNESCSCSSGYQEVDCGRVINACVNNGPCDNVTEDCVGDPNNGTAICSCKEGYERNATTDNCTDIDECSVGSYCDPNTSDCANTNGNYTCTCKSGYELINNICQDINECSNPRICSGYANTLCTNIPGLYQCLCKSGYSVGGGTDGIYENVLNTNNTCVPNNYSSFCANECIEPAVCISTGQCQCRISTLNLISISNNTQKTCQCPGYPLVTYNNSVCASSTSGTWFLMYFTKFLARSVSLVSPNGSTLENEIAKLLQSMSINANESDVQITAFNESNRTTVDYFVQLNKDLTATQRVNLTAQLFQQNLLLPDANLTNIKMIINDETKAIASFDGPPPICRVCDLLGHGDCSPSDSATCRCYNPYTGTLCETEISSTLQSTPLSTNWTVIVAVISAVAGLLLIVTLAMVVCYCVSKYRRSKLRREPRLSFHDSYVIPRAHIPTLGTLPPVTRYSDGFSSSINQYHDESTTTPSSSSTTYQAQQPIFDIFDRLEDERAMRKRPVYPAMAGTLNSFPSNPFDETIGRTNGFQYSTDLNQIEFVTDMMDEMTRDDNLQDQFIEALNPNVIVPRPTGWSSSFS